MTKTVWALGLLSLLALVSLGSCRSTTAIPSTTTEEDPIHFLQMALDDPAEEKNKGFYACCKKNSIFSSDQETRAACRYSGFDALLVDKLPEQKQSDWLKCLGGNHDDTSCCRNEGVRWARVTWMTMTVQCYTLIPVKRSSLPATSPPRFSTSSSGC